MAQSSINIDSEFYDYSALNFIQKDGFRLNSYLDYKRDLEKRTEYTIATKNKYLATAKIFLKELNRCCDDKEVIYLAPATVEAVKKHIRINKVRT